MSTKIQPSFAGQSRSMNSCKLIIIGSGPAGLTAGIYAARAELKPLLLAGTTYGGQLMLTTDVGNYPGFIEDLLGPELIDRMLKQAQRFGTEIVYEDVSKVDFSRRPFRVWTAEKEYQAQAVIIATGARALWLGLPSEQRLIGHGVSSCAPCLPPGSNIIANGAPQAIEDIIKGQRVLTHKGDFREVEKAGSRPYKGKLIKIITRYFREEPTLLTPEHPVFAVTLTRGTGPNYWKTMKWSDPEWIPAGQLTPKHILLYPIVTETKDVDQIRLSELLNLPVDSRGKVHYSYETYTARRIPDIIPINKDFMRFAGYFLAEGTANNRGFNLYFGPKDKEYVDDAVRIITKLFHYEPRVKIDRSVYRIECYAGILRDLFRKLFGRYSYGKSVPHWFMYLPQEKQAELIKGFWCGDGGTKKLNFVLVTNSPKLLTQFKMIFLRLGIIPQILKQSKDQLNKNKHFFEGREIKFKHDRYQMLIGGKSLEKMRDILGVDHPLLHRRKRSNEFAWIKGSYAYLPIAKLENLDYEGLVYNLAVAEDNSYVTAGATVHNCDAFFYKEKKVVVIGGGDTALEEAAVLTKFASEVTVIHRRDQLRASKILQRRAMENPKIKFIWNTAVTEVLGKDKVEGVKLKNLQSDEESELQIDGVFVAIGHEPNTKFLQGSGLDIDEKGYIKIYNGSRTNLEGVFVAGDVHDHVYRQAITAAGAGCKAAMDAERWLAEQGS